MGTPGGPGQHQPGIVLDPHSGASCVLTLHEVGGAELRDALVEWLGSKGTR
jgi:hypothetical protein